jgi:hypothetical protein
MSSIDVFREYLDQFYPRLVSKDWLVDTVIIEREEIVIKKLREMIPIEMQRVKCLLFFYTGGDKNVVYLLQDELGGKNWVIALVTNNLLIDAITI